MTDTRYVHLKGNLYYDSKDKVIVQNMGNRFVFLRHDRRSGQAPVKEGKRSDDQFKKFVFIQGNLFFDPATRQIYKKTAKNFVLYTRDRRKSRKPVGADRRKKQL